MCVAIAIAIVISIVICCVVGPIIIIIFFPSLPSLWWEALW